MADGLIGQRIGPYTVLDLVGRGGMGVVYRAAGPSGGVVALKVMAPELARDDDFRQRFIRESQVQLEHPNVIKVFDAGLEGDTLYLAMHLVEGPDLKSVITSEGRLLPARVVAIMNQACAALDAAHENAIVHRDIKPQNFLLDRATGDERLYLTDFGLVKSVTSQSSLTASAHLMGTAQYMAPEQIRNRPIDGRTDIYSLGCVLYECLTGSVPYGGREEVAVLFSHVNDPPPKVSEKVPVLPRALDDIVTKAMAKDPGDRYLAAGDLAAELEATLQGGRSGKPLWGDLEIRSRARPEDRKGAKQPVAADAGRRGGITGWLVAGLSLIVTAIVVSGGDPRTPNDGPVAALFDRDSASESPAATDDQGTKPRARSDGGAGRDPNGDGKGGATTRALRDRLVEVDAAQRDDTRAPDTSSPERDVAHPATGTYVYEQSGREALCPVNSGCTEGADLPESVETRVSEVGSTAATDEVVSTRISDRFSMASFVVYRPGGVSLRETVMSFRTSHGAFEVRLRPEPPAEILGSPLEPGERWQGSWINAPTEGSYSVEVLDRDRSVVGGRRIATVRVKTILRWKGQHAGTLEMTSWVDPETRATLESVVQVRARTGQEDFSYEATFHHVLTRGPGYSS